MEEIYVIVHEWFVDRAVDMGKEFAADVKNELNWIKTNKKFVSISVNEKPAIIHPELPPPSSNLLLKVCGAFTHKEYMCVDIQCLALRIEGYNAQIYSPATLESKV